jgi:hypothetical protein
MLPSTASAWNGSYRRISGRHWDVSPRLKMTHNRHGLPLAQHPNKAVGTQPTQDQAQSTADSSPALHTSPCGSPATLADYPNRRLRNPHAPQAGFGDALLHGAVRPDSVHELVDGGKRPGLGKEKPRLADGAVNSGDDPISPGAWHSYLCRHSAVYDVPLARLGASILMQAANEEPPALD